MPLMTALMTAADTLGYLQKQFETTQNNVSNANTPGYARQRLNPLPLPFSPEQGLAGGVQAGTLESSRDEFADASVRRQTTLHEGLQQQKAVLGGLEPLFPVGTDAGIPAALTQMFQSFSSWSINPNSTSDRNSVITQAGEVARRFNEAASALSDAGAALDPQIGASVDAINQMVGHLRDLNVRLRESAGNRSDPNLDAQVHDSLDQLAAYVQVTVVRQDDGSVTLLAGGQVPLLVGDRAYALQADVTSGPPIIRDSLGKDVTASVASGQLGALVGLRSETIPSYQAELNRLAGAVAGRINDILAAGVDSNGDAGAPLFTSVPGNEATTLAVTSITAPELAAAVPDAPGGNGNTLTLAGLGSSPEMDGLTFTEFYGTMAAAVGHAVSAAKENEQMQADLLAQAQSVRQDISGVSVDEEAIRLIEFQRAYQANARFVSVLNQLTEETVNLLK